MPCPQPVHLVPYRLWDNKKKNIHQWRTENSANIFILIYNMIGWEWVCDFYTHSVILPKKIIPTV